MILSIETSTDVCSVALSDAGRTLMSLEYEGAPQHAARLAPMIQDLMAKASLNYRDLDAVAVSSGPGPGSHFPRRWYTNIKRKARPRDPGKSPGRPGRPRQNVQETTRPPGIRAKCPQPLPCFNLCTI